MFPNPFKNRDQIRIPQAGQHGTAANINRGYIDTHHGIVHTRDDLVAVAYAYPGIAGMRADNSLDLVSYQLPGRQGILHPKMSHRDTIANSPANISIPNINVLLFQFLFNHTPYLVKMGMARDLCGVRINYSNKRSLKVLQGTQNTFGHHQRNARHHFRTATEKTAAAFPDSFYPVIHRYLGHYFIPL